MTKNVVITIRKPLYDTEKGYMVYIYDKVLKKAVEKGVKVEVRIPAGVEIIDPVKWLKKGKRMEKVFRRPEEPMILYGNYIRPKTEEEKQKESDKLLIKSLL